MTTPTVYYHWPSGRRLFCRVCDGLRGHEVAGDPRYVYCVACGNRVLGAQVVSLYSDDKYARTPEILLPLTLRADSEVRAIVSRIVFWSDKLGAIGRYVPGEEAVEDPYEGLDEILEELT